MRSVLVGRVLDEAVGLFERLPVEQRLDALGRLQARVMAAVLEEQVRQAVSRLGTSPP